MILEYRTLLAGFMLALLSVTLGVAFLAWRGANEAIGAIERTQAAHDALDGLLRVRVDTNRLLTDLTLSALAGGTSPLTEDRAEARIRAELGQVRNAIAREVAMLGSAAERTDEADELEQLHRVELAIDAVVREFDAVSRLLAAGQRDEAARRIRTAVDKDSAGGGVARAFRGVIQAAIDEEEREVKLAREQALASLARSARLTQAAAALALLLTAAGLVLLVKRLRRPLQQLSQVAGAVARGDIASRVEVDGDDEFARVSRAINTMLDELETHRSELTTAQAALEATVSTRTAELQAANEALRGIDALRRRFLADISHELRTPLTIIRGEGEVALRGRVKSADEYHTTLQRIVEQAGHTARLVDDLLFIARSDANHLRVNLQPVAFDELVRSTCVEAQALAGAKSMTIEFSAPVGRAVVQGDPGRLRQLLHVLLDNAVRYGEPGSSVNVVLAAGAIGVALRVCDRGAGIAEADLPHVFERFYRGANAVERHRDGSGLGLPMAKAIVEAHRGSIDVASVVGEGTTLTVQLPAMRELRTHDASARP